VSKFSKYLFFLRKNCKNLGVGSDLTEFAKILKPKSLKKIHIYIYIYIYKRMGILRIFIGFNRKSQRLVEIEKKN
jgi:hypothetical protein